MFLNKKNKKQILKMKQYLLGKYNISETVLLTLILSLVGGFTDAHTFSLRGGVLANAQTGNIVRMSNSIAEANWEKVLFYMIPILAFSIGVLIAEFLKNKIKNKNIHWRQIIILVEIIIFIVASFVSQGKMDSIVNIMLSFTSSLQFQSFKITNGTFAATTMCTGNLRSGNEQLYLFLIKKDKTSKKFVLIYFSMILTFIIGAIIGSLFTFVLREKALMFACLPLIIVFLLLYKEK